MSNEDRLFTKRQAAVVAIGVMWPGALMRVLALIGALISTVGLLTFFFFDDLAPYRWWMIIGGSLASFGFGVIGDRITPTRGDIAAIDMDEIVRDSFNDTARDNRNDT